MNTDRSKRDKVLRDAMERLAGKLEEQLPPLCETQGITSKTSKMTKCMNDVWQKNFVCGDYSLLLHLNYSKEMNYFSVRVLRFFDLKSDHNFKVETLLEERYEVCTTPDDAAIFHSQTSPGEKYNEKEFLELCSGLVESTFQ